MMLGLLERIEWIVKRKPDINCYLLALILKSEFNGTIYYNMDHCIFVTDNFIAVDKDGIYNFKEDDIEFIPIDDYSYENIQALIDAI